jgi:hypothetical protein
MLRGGLRRASFKPPGLLDEGHDMNTLIPAFSIFLGFGLAAAASAAPCNEANSIIRVRNTTQGPFDYVIFRYQKPPQIPAFTVKGANPPFTQDGSGNPVTVGGAKFTEVRFSSIVWTCTIDDKLKLPRPAVVDVKNIGQFEGIITFIIGRKAAAHFISTYSYDVGTSDRNVVVKYRK